MFRAIALTLRAGLRGLRPPSAPLRRLRDIFLLAQPPLLREEESIAPEQLCCGEAALSFLWNKDVTSCFFDKVFRVGHSPPLRGGMDATSRKYREASFEERTVVAHKPYFRMRSKHGL